MQGGHFAALLAIWLLCGSLSEGASLQRSPTELRCQCVKTESGFISPKQIEKVEITPSGPHCPNVEVIMVLHSGQKVCVDPEAAWVKKIMDWISKRDVPITEEKP
ncbi:interleukin-8-like [Lissotriton helveticus]